VICTDKTGTLTRNVMAVPSLDRANGSMPTEAAHSRPFDSSGRRSGLDAESPDQGNGRAIRLNGARRAAANVIDPGAETENPRRNPVGFRPKDDDDPQPTAGRKAGGLQGAPEVVAERCDRWADRRTARHCRGGKDPGVGGRWLKERCACWPSLKKTI
jgi:magnesium-transporting ATPase (P-type)